MNSRSLRFVHNTLHTIGTQSVMMAITFVATPILVKGLGMESYSLYVLLQTVATYVLALSFAATSGPTVARYVAALSPAGASRALWAVVPRAIPWNVAGILATASAAWIFAEDLGVWVGTPGPAAVGVFRCAAAGAVFISFYQLAAGALQGLERFTWCNYLGLAQHLLFMLGGCALIAKGMGVTAIAAWFVAVHFLSALASSGLIAGFMRGGGALPQAVASPDLKQLWRFGRSLWFASLISIVTYQFDRILIPHYLSLAELTLYAIPAGLIQRLWAVPAAMNTILGPMFARLSQEEAIQELPRLYLRATFAILSVTLGPMALIFTVAPQFFALWVGPEFSVKSFWTARLLIGAHLLYSLSYVACAAVAAREKPSLLFVSALAQAVCSVTFWLLLIPRAGVLGVALGAFLAQLVPALIITPWAHFWMGVATGAYLEKALYKPFAAAAVMMAACFPVHGWASTWPRLIALCCGANVLYVATLWILIDRDDRRILWEYLSKFAGGR